MYKYRVLGKKENPEDKRTKIYLVELLRTGERKVVSAEAIRLCGSDSFINVQVGEDGRIGILARDKEEERRVPIIEYRGGKGIAIKEAYMMKVFDFVDECIYEEEEPGEQVTLPLIRQDFKIEKEPVRIWMQREFKYAVSEDELSEVVRLMYEDFKETVELEEEYPDSYSYLECGSSKVSVSRELEIVYKEIEDRKKAYYFYGESK